MGDKSAIEWTEATWNPVTGCTKVSAGCKNCYAEAWWPRLRTGRPFTEVRCHPDRLSLPLRWRKPRRIFVNSMSDLFHEDVPDEFIGRVWSTMRDSPRHTFQILTKRPGRMREFVLSNRGYSHALGQPKKFYPYEPPPNVWLGVSCEDQATADKRIPLLLQTPAAVRFVSLEPILSHIDVGDRHRQELASLDWVIVGGESGPGARPSSLDWIADVITQCRAAHVPVFVKQLGSDPCSRRWSAWPALRDRKGGDPLEWPEDLRVREFPTIVPQQ